MQHFGKHSMSEVHGTTKPYWFCENSEKTCHFAFRNHCESGMKADSSMLWGFFLLKFIYLSAARLRHLLHLLQNTDEDVWAMLQQGSAWWELLEVDLHWLQDQRRCPLPFGTLLED